MASKLWTRDEVLVAFNLYCRTPFGRLHARNPEIESIAQQLGRTPSAVAMKCCNLASFDPALIGRGIKGLSKASELDGDVWKEFEQDPEKIGFESELAFSRITGMAPRLEAAVDWGDIEGLDKESVRKVRINQHLFRSIVMSSYGSECAVCSLPFRQLLVASHIIPWSIERHERMNPRNGICLCSLHDKAFDRGLMLISPEYVIRLTSQVTDLDSTDSVRRFFIAYEGKSIRVPDRWHPDPVLLQRRNEN